MIPPILPPDALVAETIPVTATLVMTDRPSAAPISAPEPKYPDAPSPVTLTPSNETFLTVAPLV